MSSHDQRRDSDGQNREAILQMLAALTAMAEQLAVASRDIAQHPDATAADRQAVVHDVEVRAVLSHALTQMAGMMQRDLEQFPITARIGDRIKTAFRLSDQAMQAAMRIAHSNWLPKVAAADKARYPPTDVGRKGVG